MAAVDSKNDILRPIRKRAKIPYLRDRDVLPPRQRPGSKFSPVVVMLKNIANAIEQRNFVILIPFALILGIIAYRMASTEPNLWATLSVAAAITTIAIFRSRERIAYGAVLAAAMVCGFALISFKSAFDGSKMLPYPIVVEQFSGKLDKIIAMGQGAKLIVRVKATDDKRLSGIKFVRLTVREQHLLDHSPSVGDILVARVRLAPVPKPIVPRGYDGQFANYFSGVGAYGNTLGEAKFTSAPDFKAGITRLRFTAGALIDTSLSDERAAIAKALIIGDQRGISDELRQKIADAGLAHVLAISGLHLTLVVGSALILVRTLLANGFLPDRFIRPVAIFISIGVAFGYLLVSGANLATQRATIMLLLAFGAMLFGRRAITMRNAALAGLLIILLFPAEIFKPGFQLSFAAVLGLVAAYSEVNRFSNRLPKWVNWLGGLAFTSLIAGAVTAPIAAIHFQQFAPFGLFGNLLAVPIVGFWVLPFGFLSVLLMPFGLQAIGLVPMGMGIDLVVIIAHIISTQSGDLAHTPVYGTWTLFAALFMFAALSFLQGWAKLIAPIIFMPIFLIFGPSPPPLMLISDTTQAVIVKAEAGYQIVGRKYNSFTLRAWRERFDDKLLDRETIGACDKRGCFATFKKHKIAIVKSKIAFYEDCGTADILIVKMRGDFNCPTSFTITQSQLDKNGVAAIYQAPGSSTQEKDHPSKTPNWHIEWAITDHHRPWRPK